MVCKIFISKFSIFSGVFVRVFNEQPQFQLPDPEGYLKSLLDYLGNQAQYFASIGADGTVDQTRLKQTSMALQSVFHVLSANQAFSMKCVNSLRLLSSFFVNEHTTSEIQLNTLRIFGIVAAVQEVVLAIAQQRLLSSILLVVERLTAQEHLFFLQVLSALSSHPEIVKQFIPTGGVLYTTNLFANSAEPAVRKEAASLLAKVTRKLSVKVLSKIQAISDRLSGPRVRISLSKLLPPIFADAMADNAEASVSLYEGIHENPELIWSEETRQQTSLYLERSARDLSQQQAKNPEVDWKPPSESFLPNKEFILGGVYIRLLLLNPGWQLRRPKEFITTLFDRITDLTEPTNGQVDQNELDQLSEAGCGLFTTQINLSKLGKRCLSEINSTPF
jgi:DnaJ homolog subfamily C member 13